MRLQNLSMAMLGLLGVAHAQDSPPPDLHLRGDRFAPLTYERMTPAQKTMTDHVLASERASMKSGNGRLGAEAWRDGALPLLASEQAQ
jgi:hypothetical protein